MGNYKLPKPQKRDKGKNKASSGPGNYHEALEAALEFEEKAERYRSGSKALNNWERALEAYKIASLFDSSQADPLYNSARILQTLAEDHIAAPKASECLANAIQHYQQASRLDPESTDILFNLAMALVVQGENELQPATQLEIWKQALTTMHTVEEKQTAQMQSQDFNPQQLPEGEEDDGDAEAEGGGEETGEKQVTEASTVIVPATIAETVIASLEVLQMMLDTLPDDATEQQAETEQLISNTGQRLAKLAALSPTDEELQLSVKHAELDVSLSLLLRTFQSSGRLDDDAWQALLRDFQVTCESDDISRQCEVADAMHEVVFLLASANRAVTAAELSHKALELYHHLAQLLNSPISARSLPPQSLAPTKSNVYASAALLQLLEQDVPAATQSSINAIEASQTGVHFQPGQGFAKTRTPDTREDLNAVKAVQNGAMVFARVALHVQDSSAQTAAVDLLKKLQITQTHLTRAIEDYEDDPLWTGLGDGRVEPAFWQTVAAQLAA